MNFIDMNISAGLVILMIIVIRKIFITKVNHKVIMIMWLIALFRLILPFSNTFEYSIFNLVRQTKNFVENPDIISFTGNTDMPVFAEQQINSMNSVNDIGTSSSTSYNYITIVWLIGITIFSLYFLIQLFYTIKIIKSSRHIDLLNISKLNNSISKINLKRKVIIKISNTIKSPASLGIFKPVILFPKDFKFDDVELLNHITIHEYMHIKNYHFIIKIISIIFLCVFWFNPAVWLAYLYVDRDIEILCDRQVIKFIGYEEREKYALNLVDMLPEKKEYGLRIYNNFIKNSTKERICSVMKIKNITVFSTLSVIVIAVSTSFVFATSSNIYDGNEINKLEIVSVEPAYDSVNVNTNIVEEVPTLELDISEIEEYIKKENRAASYIDISNYKYVTSSASPSRINVSIKDSGYTYTGTLYLDGHIYNASTKLYTGYYSGRLYR